MNKGLTADDRFDDDPERVRRWLVFAPAGPWCVFEALAADGSLAIGVSSAPLTPGTLMVIYDGLTEEIAALAASDLHRWRRRQATV